MASTSILSYSCEICGQDGFSDEGLRGHISDVHVNGALTCPFCNLSSSEITVDEMCLHVNKTHLDILTPDRDDNDGFLDDDNLQCEMGSIFRLDRSARAGLTNGVDKSPPEHADKSIPCGGVDSPMSTSTNESDTGDKSPHRGSNSGAIQKTNQSAKEGSVRASLDLKLDPSFASPNEAKVDIGGSKCPLCGHAEADPAKLEEHVNRAHFDPASPKPQETIPTSSQLPCPLCNCSYPTSLELERHVNNGHADILSPMQPTSTETAETTDGNGNDQPCPVCHALVHPNQLPFHIETHFTKSSPSLQSTVRDNVATSSDFALARELARQERARRHHEEKREFERLRAQFGMDNDGNFRQQSISSMQNAVHRGEMSVVDYYERQSELREAEQSGVDDGRSRTRALVPRLRSLCSSQAFLATTVDHYSSTFGDKGWGCGYRNLQMLLSSIVHDKPTFAHLSGLSGTTSIPRLQALIEDAWKKGFDPQGADQLGNRLVNTRKWIGATEIVAFLTANRVKTELVDFHRPTGGDGSHGRLVAWVVDYFRDRASRGAFAGPLYLQHQGHSRTIVGVEVGRDCSSSRLLVFDPSHSRESMSRLARSDPGRPGSAASALKMLRQGPGSLKSRQYQVVAVTGAFDTEAEAAAHKTIRSKRIP